MRENEKQYDDSSLITVCCGLTLRLSGAFWAPCGGGAAKDTLRLATNVIMHSCQGIDVGEWVMRDGAERRLVAACNSSSRPIVCGNMFCVVMSNVPFIIQIAIEYVIGVGDLLQIGTGWRVLVRFW